MIPSTAEVLRVIGTNGVIVGSVAAGKKFPKDIDLVVKGCKLEERHNPVFQAIIARWPMTAKAGFQRGGVYDAL